MSKIALKFTIKSTCLIIIGLSTQVGGYFGCGRGHLVKNSSFVSQTCLFAFFKSGISENFRFPDSPPNWWYVLIGVFFCFFIIIFWIFILWRDFCGLPFLRFLWLFHDMVNKKRFVYQKFSSKKLELTVMFFSKYMYFLTFLSVYSKRVFCIFNSNGNYSKHLVVSWIILPAYGH